MYPEVGKYFRMLTNFCKLIQSQKSTMFKLKWKYLLIAFLLLVIEILIALFVHDKIIRPFGGDFLVVIFLYCLLRGLLNKSSLHIAGYVLLFAFAVEVSQYLNLIDVLGLGDNKIATLILGNRFSWGDMLVYTLGVAMAWFIDKKATT